MIFLAVIGLIRNVQLIRLNLLGIMRCTVCTAAHADNVFAKEGNSNFRKDKLVDHDNSKTHKLAKEASETISQTATDILQPVSLFLRVDIETTSNL